MHHSWDCGAALVDNDSVCCRCWNGSGWILKTWDHCWGYFGWWMILSPSLSLVILTDGSPSLNTSQWFLGGTGGTRGWIDSVGLPCCPHGPVCRYMRPTKLIGKRASKHDSNKNKNWNKHQTSQKSKVLARKREKKQANMQTSGESIHQS